MTKVDMRKVVQRALEKASALGLEVKRGGSFFLDETLVFKALSEELRKYNILYLDIREAIKEHRDLIEKYSEKIGIKIPKKVSGGVLLYIPEGVRVCEPIFTCFALSKPGFTQKIANLYIIEDHGEAVAAKGCLAYVKEGAHVGLTGVYLGKGAKLISVMLHNWMPKVAVSSYTKAFIANYAELYEYYINLTPLYKIKYLIDMFLEGKNSTARSDMVIIGKGSSQMNYEVNASLKGEGSTVELRSRILGKDNSRVISKASISAYAPETRGHIECHGLLLSNNAKITTIPRLESIIPETMLTHEASIGRISKDALNYLMAKGFTEEEAVSIIIRGFIEIGLERIPQKLRYLIIKTMDIIAKSKM